VTKSVRQIISGGQTGADRGGLDAAIALDLSHGGWCPRGRRAEDGIIPAKYKLVETSERDYRSRTIFNIRDSDATVVFVRLTPTPGSALTLATAESQKKPCTLIDVSLPMDVSVDSVRGFLARWSTCVRLNVAGTRESKASGIQVEVRDILVEALRD